MTQSENYVQQLLKDFEQWRKNTNYTQKEVAEQLLHITRSHLNKVLNGKTAPSLYLIQRMEEVMKNDK